MPVVIPNGGGGDVTSAELNATDAALRERFNTGTQTFTGYGSGSQTPAEVEVVNAVEEKVAVIAEGWVDSGGPGGHQRAVASEILRRAALMQGNLARSVRQWAKPGQERAMLEMLGVLVGEIHMRDRLLLELRERLNVSPY